MLNLLVWAKRLKADRRGISALEYGILAAVVVVALIAVSGNFNELFSTVFSTLNSAVIDASTS